MIGLAAAWGAFMCGLMGFSMAYAAGIESAGPKGKTGGLFTVVGLMFLATMAWLLAAPNVGSVTLGGLWQLATAVIWVWPPTVKSTSGRIVAILSAVGALLAAFAVFSNL